MKKHRITVYHPKDPSVLTLQVDPLPEGEKFYVAVAKRRSSAKVGDLTLLALHLATTPVGAGALRKPVLTAPEDFARSRWLVPLPHLIESLDNLPKGWGYKVDPAVGEDEINPPPVSAVLFIPGVGAIAE